MTYSHRDPHDDADAHVDDAEPMTLPIAQWGWSTICVVGTLVVLALAALLGLGVFG